MEIGGISYKTYPQDRILTKAIPTDVTYLIFNVRHEGKWHEIKMSLKEFEAWAIKRIEADQQ